MIRNVLTLAVFLVAAPTFAWNSLGHKVIADIAWRQLEVGQRAQVVAMLRRHPRFDDDFAKRRGETVADEDRWVFQHAATWPDLARGLPAGERGKYDRPTWHYINLPVFVGGERPVRFNTSLEPADQPNPRIHNVAQALAQVREVLASDAPPAEKAVAYCWLFHLVGDLHQPMHAVSLVSERMPAGDRGGNSIPVRRGGNLHSLWDNLLGRQDRMADVAREIAELEQHPYLWNAGTKTDIPKWIEESRELADHFAYDPIIRAAMEPTGDLPPIELPESYARKAGEHAKRRIIAAGLRLGVLLGGSGEAKLNPDVIYEESDPFGPDEQATRAGAKASTSPTDGPHTSLTHWLNLNGNVRHNSGCRYFDNTKRGRPCGPDEGKPCGICGG